MWLRDSITEFNFSLTFCRVCDPGCHWMTSLCLGSLSYRKGVVVCPSPVSDYKVSEVSPEPMTVVISA